MGYANKHYLNMNGYISSLFICFLLHFGQTFPIHLEQLRLPHSNTHLMSRSLQSLQASLLKGFGFSGVSEVFSFSFRFFSTFSIFSSFSSSWLLSSLGIETSEAGSFNSSISGNSPGCLKAQNLV